jgi:hypothetical protein
MPELKQNLRHRTETRVGSCLRMISESRDAGERFARAQHMAKPQIESEPKPPFPEQKLPKPGLEAELKPRPRYKAPRYKPAGKL